MKRPIRLIRARQNNLKNISVDFPAGQISVITGLSGSGKSSLAFDTLYAEGQRRYIESLSTYTRQFLAKMPKPDLDGIENIPPAIALEQKNTLTNSRSTVGSQTEIVDYLRLLFAKIGETFCVDCGHPVRAQDVQTMLSWAEQFLIGHKVLLLAPLASPLAAPSPKKRKNEAAALQGAKSAKKASKTIGKTTHPSLASLFALLKGQGFQRVVVRSQAPSSATTSVKKPGQLADPAPTAKAAAFLASADTLTLYDLEELPATLDVALEDLFVVVDRFALQRGEGSSSDRASVLDPDARSRLLDSLEQALKVGQGSVIFCQWPQPALKEDPGWRDPERKDSNDPNNGDALAPSTYDSRWKVFKRHFGCTFCLKSTPALEASLFSFNSPLGACESCSGFGATLELDEQAVVPQPQKTLKNGAIDPLAKPSLSDRQTQMFRFAERHGISIGKRYQELTAAEKQLLWEGDPQDKSSSSSSSSSAYGTFPGIRACFAVLKRYHYKLHVRVFIRRYQKQEICRSCQGTRLKKEARAVQVAGLNLPQLLALSIEQAALWFQALRLNPTQKTITQSILPQIARRLSFLEQVGVGYLTLERVAKTLSGGEFQRIHLATQLGNGLCGTLYVLDEPSIGLHASDTARLIQVLTQLKQQGNTVVIVEHDLEVMRAADWIIELGPAAGSAGGELMAQGTPQTVMDTKQSLTGKYLSGVFELTRARPPREESLKKLVLTGCRGNNLKNLTVEFPLGRLVVVTGVSGSGKSSLVHHTLFAALLAHFEQTPPQASAVFSKLTGTEHLSGVSLLDQSSIGKSSRSNPATYLKIWDEIRKLLSHQVSALKQGLTPQYFSFNVDGGRCPACQGAGEITLDMHFLAEVSLPCEVCDGKRFQKKVLDVQYRNKNVHQILTSTIDEAFELFRDAPPVVVKKLGLLREVGLGYLQLGQSSKTLSGGESQRLKIAATLDQRQTQSLLYLLDEPTTGLHLEDVKKLLLVLQDLVEAGQSVILIEHHLDVIAASDWVIDLGPGGGTQGGELVAAGTPEQLMHHPRSATGAWLRAHGYLRKR